MSDRSYQPKNQPEWAKEKFMNQEEFDQLIDTRRQQHAERLAELAAKFPGLNSHWNYKYGKPLPAGLVSIPTDNSIRRIKKAGIEYREIVELVYTGRRHVPRVRGYAVRESDWLLVQCNFDHEELLKVAATESDSQK
jgi:hypothetical protein